MSNTNYWLSPAGPLGNGSGSSAANAADASTQAKLDAIWLANMGGYSSSNTITFQYLPGLFQTKGWNFNGAQTIQSGNIHQGSGLGLSTIQLIGAQSSTNDGFIFGNNGGSNVWINTWAAYDLTLDANATAQPKWTGSPGTVGQFICYGGQNIQIQRVKFINFGTSLLGAECFPCGVIASSFSASQTIDNCLISNCIFTTPAAGNKDGCSIVAFGDTISGNVTITQNNIVQNCQFINCWQPSGCQGDFLYCHCVGAPQALNNVAINSGVFYYLEPSQAGSYANLTAVVNGNVQLFSLGAMTDQFFRILPHLAFGPLTIAIYPSNVIAENVKPFDIATFMEGFPLMLSIVTMPNPQYFSRISGVLTVPVVTIPNPQYFAKVGSVHP